AHSDDKGLVVPPKLAPIHGVVVPIWMKDHQVDDMLKAGQELFNKLQETYPGLDFELDDRRQQKAGVKFAQWEQKGVPVRLELGPRDLEKGQVVVVRRDTGEKEFMSQDEAIAKFGELMTTIQSDLYEKAKAFREENTHLVDDYETFKSSLEEKGGFYLAHWDGTDETEAKVQAETKATIRAIPFGDTEEGKCMVTGKPSKQRVVFAKAY
ncbi:MAG: proline--tRNA ligase, partial [Candidatus Eisenbacteria bacterium]|nr:proline--tRNA ligase [Candidatus Eisenbacteria bacterium]